MVTRGHESLFRDLSKLVFLGTERGEETDSFPEAIGGFPEIKKQSPNTKEHTLSSLQF